MELDWRRVSFREVVSYHIGGGWGKDVPDDKHTEIAWVIRGTDIPATEVGDVSGVPHRYHKASNLRPRRLQANDIVLEISGGSRDQPVGRALLVSERRLGSLVGDTMCASFCKLVRFDAQQVCPRFVLDHLRLIYENRQIMEFQTQSTGISNFDFEDFLDRHEVYLPPLEVQRKIAAVLGAHDELIENNLRRIEILEEMAQAVYREWFVNFRYPGHEADDLVDSPLGPIPEGWDVARLGDRIELVYGKALRKNDRRVGAVPVFGSSGVIGWHDTALAQGPGIIVGRKGNVGAVHWSSGAFYPIDTTFYVRTDMPLQYVLRNLRDQSFINSDAAVPGLNRSQALANLLLVPSPTMLERFEATQELMTELRANLARQNGNLRATRDLLLPKLLSGEIDVSGLDIDTSWLVA